MSDTSYSQGVFERHHKVVITSGNSIFSLIPELEACQWKQNMSDATDAAKNWEAVLTLRDAQTPWHTPNLWHLTHRRHGTCQTCDIWRTTCQTCDIWCTDAMAHAKPVTSVVRQMSQVWHVPWRLCVRCHRFGMWCVRCHRFGMWCVRCHRFGMWCVRCHRFGMCHGVCASDVMASVRQMSCHVMLKLLLQKLKICSASKVVEINTIIFCGNVQ